MVLQLGKGLITSWTTVGFQETIFSVTKLRHYNWWHIIATRTLLGRGCARKYNDRGLNLIVGFGPTYFPYTVLTVLVTQHNNGREMRPLFHKSWRET